MVRIISVWIRYPISGWSEASKEDYIALEKDFPSGDAFVSALCSQYNFSAKTIKCLSTEIVCGCEKHHFKIKTQYQVEHAEYNQAEYEVKIVVRVHK